MIEVQSVKYTLESENELTFSVGGKGIHGIFCDDDGETALLTDILSGAKEALVGTVLIGKEEVKLRPSEQRERIGVALSKMPFYDDITVMETLGFIATAKKIDPEKSSRQIKEALSLLGIENIAKKQIKRLSIQNRRRVSAAQALLGNPDTIIFESPTADIGEICEKEMRELIKMLGNIKSVVILSSDSDLLVDVCEDVKVISGGRLLFDGSSEELAFRLDGSRRITVTLKGSEENIEKASLRIKVFDGVEFLECDGNTVTVDFDSKLINREAILSAFEGSGLTVRAVKISARALAESLGKTQGENKEEEE
ncbi:MAG: ATP-binding cassette domain-containing protein [Ruminococcaceae bacterium]|nr:ATP-binding cassette domain-containing protein [Oscillospiraceae bacterium]